MVPEKWKINTYDINFTTSGVSGVFKTLTGDIVFDENDFAQSKFDITIDANSIATGNTMMDEDAKGKSWFDAATYPGIQFTSAKIIKTPTGFEATGNLRVHGITKEIKLPFTFKRSEIANTAIFSGSFDVNRVDFSIGKPGNDVGEVLKVNVALSVIK